MEFKTLLRLRLHDLVLFTKKKKKNAIDVSKTWSTVQRRRYLGSCHSLLADSRQRPQARAVTVMTLHCTLRGVQYSRRHWKGPGRHINLAAVWIPGCHCISFKVCRWVAHKHSGIAPAAGGSSASIDVRMQQCGQLGSTPGYDCTNSAFMQVLQVSADN